MRLPPIPVSGTLGARLIFWTGLCIFSLAGRHSYVLYTRGTRRPTVQSIS